MSITTRSGVLYWFFVAAEMDVGTDAVVDVATTSRAVGHDRSPSRGMFGIGSVPS